MSAPEPASTQERHPWRSAIRTGFQVLVGIISVVPYIVAEVDVPAEGFAGQVIGVTVAMSRIMAIPQVNELLRRHLPALAPGGRPPE